MKIAICGVSIGDKYNKKDWVKYALQNHKDYSNRHNYTYILRNLPKTNRESTWEKIDLIKQTIISNKYDYIFWMDTDSIFTNFTITIEDIINNDVRLYSKKSTFRYLEKFCKTTNNYENKLETLLNGK